MKAIGVIGYKKSGKTTLVTTLARELTQRGYKIATLKHILQAKHLDLPFKDTAKHMQYASQTAAISPAESALFFNHRKSLEEMIGYLEADFLIIEGFGQEKTFPKIVCFKESSKAKELFDGLEIGAATLAHPPQIDLGVPVFNILEDVEKIGDLVSKRAFKLPNLDCGACGYDSCYELAREIIRGKKNLKDCPPLKSETQIILNGKLLALNPFVSQMVRKTIVGMLSSLKGYRRGSIQIRIEEK
jgi:molybdopterin-guanine dinucleotide biosynthesis protein B